MTTDKNTTPILIIEDSLDDFRVMKRAFRQVGLSNRLLHFQKAEQALDYLLQRGDYAAGALVLNPEGTRHSVWSEGGCTVLIQWERPVRLLDDA